MVGGKARSSTSAARERSITGTMGCDIWIGQCLLVHEPAEWTSDVPLACQRKIGLADSRCPARCRLTRGPVGLNEGHYSFSVRRPLKLPPGKRQWPAANIGVCRRPLQQGHYCLTELHRLVATSSHSIMIGIAPGANAATRGACGCPVSAAHRICTRAVGIAVTRSIGPAGSRSHARPSVEHTLCHPARSVSDCQNHASHLLKRHVTLT